MHIALVAIERKKTNTIVMLQQAVLLFTSPPSPQQEINAGPETEVTTLSGLHASEAYINAKFPDADSISIRGELRSIEIMILSELKPHTELGDVLQMLELFRSTVRTKIQGLNRESEEPGAVVADAPF